MIDEDREDVVAKYIHETGNLHPRCPGPYFKVVHCKTGIIEGYMPMELVREAKGSVRWVAPIFVEAAGIGEDVKEDQKK